MSEAHEWKWRDLRKSSKDARLGGICGGFGEYTPLPSWLWRVLFLTFLFAGGIGLIAYIFLWLYMPSVKTGD
ncbi:MAG: PspC domain-containing protein [Candidatus Brocadiia bacterium]